MICKITKTMGTEHEKSSIIKLPKTEQELNAFLSDMGINKTNDFAYIATDFKTKNSVFDKYFNTHPANIDELNYIAKSTEGCSSEVLERITKVMSAEQPENTKEFINMMHSVDDYIIHDSVTNAEELGKELAFRVDGIDDGSPIGMCINFKEYGESYQDTFGGKFSNGSYIIPPENIVQHYDGTILPDNKKVSDAVLAVKIATYDTMNQNDIDPKGIWVKLPTTEYTLERTANRLGAESLEGCIICDSCSSVLTTHEFFEEIDPLTELNTMAEILSNLNLAEIEKFEAVMDFEGYMELSQAINTAYNLDCYEYIPYKQSSEGSLINTFDDDSADTVNRVEIPKKNGGTLCINGLVARNEEPMVQVYVSEKQPDISQQM